MAERRSLVEGIKSSQPVDPALEKDFVYRPGATNPMKPPVQSAPIARTPISTRIRADFGQALKRASLERQLSGTAPNTLQDILEEAIEPWLRNNGYLP